MGMEITAIIPTFERPDTVRNLIKSIHKFYPLMKILVGDNSKEPVLWRDAVNILVPYDCGVSEARNRLLSRVETRYVLVLDDDFVLTAETKVEEFVRVLQHSDLDIIGGWLDQDPPNKKWFEYHGILSLKHGVLEYTKGSIYECEDYKQVDIIPQFFLGEIDRVKTVGWNSKYKQAEHTDFFLRAKTIGLKVGITDKVRIDHCRKGNKKYDSFRGRGYIFSEMFYKDWGIKKCILYGKEMRMSLPKKKENYYIHDSYATNPYIHFDDTRNEENYQREFYVQATETKPKSVFDVGCGSGFKLVKYFKKCFTVGSEVEPTLGFLKEKYPDRKWILSDFNIPPTQDFDLVLCLDVIEHLEKPEVLMEYLRKLKTHKIVISTPVRTKEEGSPINEYHIREWSIYEFHKFISDYLKIDSHTAEDNKQVVWCSK